MSTNPSFSEDEGVSEERQKLGKARGALYVTEFLILEALKIKGDCVSMNKKDLEELLSIIDSTLEDTKE